MSFSVWSMCQTFILHQPSKKITIVRPLDLNHLWSSVSLSRYEFFNELYHRFLLTPKVAMKCLCLQALTIVYGKCCEEIGPFTDTKYIVGMLDRVSIQLQPWMFGCRICLNEHGWAEITAAKSFTSFMTFMTVLFWCMDNCVSHTSPDSGCFYVIYLLPVNLQCTDKLERDRLILFLNKLILNKVRWDMRRDVWRKISLNICECNIVHVFLLVLQPFLFWQKNVKDIMDSNGVRILVDLLTLAHLHTNRATVPLQVCVCVCLHNVNIH